MNKIYPLGDNIGYVELVSQMGTELDIVNDARVSFDNKKQALDDRDKKLTRFLIENQHTSPLRGVVFKFEAVVPLAVCRQW